ncbi:hypothetical protein SASPL_145512 [Salvia splendens]|uniref:START domain-containing protein n=1 Tax=Salvia splendens TaxID=180675 RepID=A0A8X8WJ72_SALSN|nr:hypothetical protein SASPL_145512 [Salvia splendens]
MEGGWTGLSNNAMEFFNSSALMEAFVDIFVCAVPIWLAVMIGLLISLSWRPRWSGLLFLGLRSKLRYVWTLPPGLGARRFWLAFTALSAFSLCRGPWFRSRGMTRKLEKESASNLPPTPAASAQESVDNGSCRDISVEDILHIIPILLSSLGLDRQAISALGLSMESASSLTGALEGESNVVTEKDLERLLKLLNVKDGDMAWQSMMERSTTNMHYQAWRHEPTNGQTIYRSKTIFEDATPELVRDFFWDDEFRPNWHPMLVYVNILEECPKTGMMMMHWIKKFPFFCSDREYIIGRRIWEQGNAYYCVTKGVPYAALPRLDNPRRVDLYFSSWVIKPDGQTSACEVNLVHYEDMGIPKDVAKLGVRHEMWGTVKKLHAGFRAYQSAKSKIGRSGHRQRGGCGIDWRWVAIGGMVAVVCGLQTGVIGTGRAMVIGGAGHRIAARRDEDCFKYCRAAGGNEAWSDVVWLETVSNQTTSPSAVEEEESTSRNGHALDLLWGLIYLRMTTDEGYLFDK